MYWNQRWYTFLNFFSGYRLIPRADPVYTRPVWIDQIILWYASDLPINKTWAHSKLQYFLFSDRPSGINWFCLRKWFWICTWIQVTPVITALRPNKKSVIWSDYIFSKENNYCPNLTIVNCNAIPYIMY